MLKMSQIGVSATLTLGLGGLALQLIDRLPGPDAFHELRGRQLGPAWFRTDHMFEPPNVPFEPVVGVAPGGDARSVLFWNDPARAQEFGPILIAAAWSSEDRPDWDSRRTVCDYIGKRLAQYGGDTMVPGSTIVDYHDRTRCIALDDAGNPIVYMARFHPARCEQRTVSFSRARYMEATPESPGLSPAMWRAADHGADFALATSPTAFAYVTDTPECHRSVGNALLTGVLMVIAFGVGIIGGFAAIKGRALVITGPIAPFGPGPTVADHGGAEYIAVIEQIELVRDTIAERLRALDHRVFACGEAEDIERSPLRSRITRVLVGGEQESILATVRYLRSLLPTASLVAAVASPARGLLVELRAAGVTVTLDRSSTSVADIVAALDG
jgi:hypothetical protein